MVDETRPAMGPALDPVSKWLFAHKDLLPMTPMFGKTKSLERVVHMDGREIELSIQATLSKGFFKADGDWTTYRRAYFSIACELEITANTDDQLLLVRPTTATQPRILDFALSVSAFTQSHPDLLKVIELVQHTPRRDKGPACPPQRTKLAFTPSLTFKVLDQFPILCEQSRIVFERVQFKQATENNGKRRAAQQYFNISVDLWARLDGGPHKPESWVKIATCVSDPLVVRGRSPGPYSDERRGITHVADMATKSSDGIASLEARKKALVQAKEDYSTINSSNEVAINSSEALSYSHSTKQERAIDAEVPTTENPPDVPLEPFVDDDSSVSSASAVFSGSAMSSVSSASFGLTEVINQYGNVILDDPGVKSLCVDGFQYVHPDRFERNLRRLLKHYSIHLREEASDDLEVEASHFAKGRSRQTANAIRQMLDPQWALRALQMKKALSREADKSQVIEHYLGRHNIHGASNKQQIVALAESTDGHSMQSNSIASEDEHGYEHMAMPRWQQVKEFMLKSNAFDGLREGLMDFIVPIRIVALKSKASKLYNNEAIYSAVISQFSLDYPRSIILTLEELGDFCLGSDSLLWERILTQLQAIRAELEHESIRKLQQHYQVKAYPIDPVSARTTSHELISAYTLNLVVSDSIGPSVASSKRNTQTPSKRSPQSASILSELIDSLRRTLIDIELKKDRYSFEPKLVGMEQIAAEAPPPILKPTSAKVQPGSQKRIGQGVLAVKAVFTRLLARWEELQRPRLRTDHKRIEWICECGSLLYADFENSNPQAVSRLAEALQKPLNHHPAALIKSSALIVAPTDSQDIVFQQPWETSTSSNVQLSSDKSTATAFDSEIQVKNLPSNHVSASSSPVLSTEIPPNANSSSSIVNSGNASEAGAITPLTAQTHDGERDQSSQESITTIFSSSSSRPKFLAVCINTGGMYKTLAEIDVSTTTSDVQLFHSIKKTYQKTRGFRARFAWLIKPIEVHFVRFTLWNLRHGYISICDKPRCIPPNDATEYEYSPRPLEPLPPMPPEILLHYLDHGEKDLSLYRRTVWSPRLCKRLDTRIIDSGVPTYGWGIHIIEGPNRQAVFWFVMVTIFSSVLSSILWSTLRNDMQGGTGLGTLIVALPPAIMAAFLFRLSGV